MNEHLHQLALDYPLSPVPRYPLGLQSHPALTRLLASHREHYQSVIESFIGYGDDLARIPLLPTGVELTEADLAALPERLTQAYHGDQAALVWFAPFIDQVYQSPDPCWRPLLDQWFHAGSRRHWPVFIHCPVSAKILRRDWLG